MRRRYSVFSLVALTASLGVGRVVEAADLFTSPLFVAANDRLECLIANVGAATRNIRIQVKNNDGSSLADTGSFPLPGGGFVGDGGTTTGGSGIYCQFTVEGSKHAYRASATIRLNGSNETSLSIPAE